MRPDAGLRRGGRDRPVGFDRKAIGTLLRKRGSTRRGEGRRLAALSAGRGGRSAGTAGCRRGGSQEWRGGRLCGLIRRLSTQGDIALVAHDMDPPDLYPYKGPRMRKVFTAFYDMLKRHAERQ